VLRAQLPSHESKYKLSRFMGFCAQRGMDPAAVAQNTFEAFHTALEEESFSRDPGAAYRDACLTWNTAASTIPCWRRCAVEVPAGGTNGDVEAFPLLAWMSRPFWPARTSGRLREGYSRHFHHDLVPARRSCAGDGFGDIGFIALQPKDT
jgi:hypothetical protein